MKQVIVRIKKGNKTTRIAYYYSRSSYLSDILDFVKDLKKGELIQVSFGRQYVVFYEYEQLVFYTKLNHCSLDEQMYESLIDNMVIQYNLQNYLPRY